MTRTPTAIMFEVEYLRLLNEDLQVVAVGIGEATAAIVEAPVALLEVLTRPAVYPVDAVERASASILRAMSKIREIQEASIRMGELVGGRLTTLTDELAESRD